MARSRRLDIGPNAPSKIKGEVKVRSSRYSKNGPCELVLEVENAETLKALEAMVRGFCWAKGTADKIFEIFPPVNVPPEIPDPLVDACWPKPEAVQGTFRFEKVTFTKEKDNQHKAIYVQSIAGYSGGYKSKAERLMEAGFSVLRSKRGIDGLIWEIWYLSSAYMAKGPIAGKKTDEIVSWLCRSIGPGTVSIEGEHWGLAAD